MNCLIIGFGRMGERYFRALKKLGFHNIHIMDKSKNKLKIAREKYNLERKKNVFSKKLTQQKFTFIF